MKDVPGSVGYAERAALLRQRWASLDPRDVRGAVLHLFPTAPCDVLDIGSGDGRDPAWLARQGHRVTAVEPVDAFREPARRAHPSPLIAWVDDALPDLAALSDGDETFDFILVTAVWMHLTEAERASAMPVLAALLRPGGRMIIAIRNGPEPEGRRMYPVSAEETKALAEAEGLTTIFETETGSVGEANWLAGARWTRLVFDRPAHRPLRFANADRADRLL